MTWMLMDVILISRENVFASGKVGWKSGTSTILSMLHNTKMSSIFSFSLKVILSNH